MKLSDNLPELAAIPAAVADHLAAYFSARREEATTIGPPVAEALAHLESFVLGGGKRIRPLYAWAGFIGGGGLNGPEDPQAMLQAASSLEFIQACALIHDDIVDSSDTRRGSPTVHRAVEQRHRQAHWRGDAAAFGEHIAILIGDLALAWAEDMFREAQLSPEAHRRGHQPWRAMRTEVIGGQILDISLEAAGSEDPALAHQVNRYKTAAYTIERPLHLGAAIAGAPESTIAAFRGYGHDIGLAFQLRDDLLGVFGDPHITGKPAGDDLREGKRTVVLATALANADTQDPAAAATLRSLVGNTEDPDDIATLMDIIDSSGAPEEIEQIIARLTDSGLAHLASAGIDGDVAATLRELAIKSTARNS